MGVGPAAMGLAYSCCCHWGLSGLSWPSKCCLCPTHEGSARHLCTGMSVWGWQVLSMRFAMLACILVTYRGWALWGQHNSFGGLLEVDAAAELLWDLGTSTPLRRACVEGISMPDNPYEAEQASSTRRARARMPARQALAQDQPHTCSNIVRPV